MSATGTGGCGPGPGPTSGSGSGASNPRKFSEKIALHTQRQAEETAAFQEVMMDITSTRVSLRRRQEESCPEEERPCLGLPGSKITLPATSTMRSVSSCTLLVNNKLTRLSVQFLLDKWCEQIWLLPLVVHFRYAVSAVSKH